MADPSETKVSFRIWANRLDRATANAMRVKLGLLHRDLDKEFSEAELDQALADTFAPNPKRVPPAESEPEPPKPSRKQSTAPAPSGEGAGK